MLIVYNRDNRELELILRSHGEFRVYYSIFNLNGYARPTEIIQNTHTYTVFMGIMHPRQLRLLSIAY